MTPLTRIPRDVARKLGYYVYIYVNPLDGRIFYVGKGKSQRVLGHLQDTKRSRKVATIAEIRRAGEEPQIEILAHGLRDEATAHRVEAAIIDLLGLPSLTNQVRGLNAATLGRARLSHLIAHYRHKRAHVHEPAILIRISKLYRPQMTPMELYDATRGRWKIGTKREKAKLAFAVFEGVVREVYEITRWFRAGSTFSTHSPRRARHSDRWEFVGQLASRQVRDRYIDRYVGHLFSQGAQNPIAYVNIK